MKVSNGMEDKTKPTVDSVFNRAGNIHKVVHVAKGEVYYKCLLFVF